jgi:hypothetical protein
MLGLHLSVNQLPGLALSHQVLENIHILAPMSHKGAALCYAREGPGLLEHRRCCQACRSWRGLGWRPFWLHLKFSGAHFITQTWGWLPYPLLWQSILKMAPVEFVLRLPLTGLRYTAITLRLLWTGPWPGLWAHPSAQAKQVLQRQAIIGSTVALLSPCEDLAEAPRNLCTIPKELRHSLFNFTARNRMTLHARLYLEWMFT